MKKKLKGIPNVIYNGPGIGADLQRIATGTIQESWSGFIGGYTLATSSNLARRLLTYSRNALIRPASVAAAASASTTASAAATINQVLPYSSLLRFSQQTLQMHSQSWRFGMEWAQMSAVFGASRLLVQTLRRKDDEWNTVLGSALAGSVFACLPKQARAVPPTALAVAMTRGSLLYGGTMFLLHPTLWKDGLHKAMLMPPSSPTTRAIEPTQERETTTMEQPVNLGSLTATRFRNQPIQWWDGGI